MYLRSSRWVLLSLSIRSSWNSNRVLFLSFSCMYNLLGSRLIHDELATLR